MTTSRVATVIERQSARCRLRAELGAYSREQWAERHGCALGHQHAGIEARQVDQLRELHFQRAGGGFDVIDQRPPFGFASAC